MSRIGKIPITIPKGVDVHYTPTIVTVKGPKGKLELTYHSRVTITREGDQLRLARHSDQRQHRAYHGLYQRLISNMIKGVTEMYAKELEIVGVGYRAQMEGKRLVLNVGHSHAIYYTPPEGIVISTPKPTQITVAGIDKQAVGETAAEIRRFRPPEPYKGKGIRYTGERVKLKEGKAGAK